MIASGTYYRFLWTHQHIPEDCHRMIHEFIPHIVEDRCHACGLALVLRDKRMRQHFEPHLVCTETIIVCTECFEMFYE